MNSTNTAMKTNTFRGTLLTALALVALNGSKVYAVQVIDTIDAADGQSNTYFVPSPAQIFISPYYRGAGQDWGWQHNPVNLLNVSSVELSIGAYDVDSNGSPGFLPEVDIITAGGFTLGSLVGVDNAFAFTTFNLDVNNAALMAEVASGLNVFMRIDENNEGWFVTLSKSVLTTNGADPGDPNPTVPDGGSTLLMMLGAIIGLQPMRKLLTKRA